MKLNHDQKKKDWKWYFDELMSDECLCGRSKKPSHSFCYRCFKTLPNDMQRDLYSRIGYGYEAAYESAFEYLNN